MYTTQRINALKQLAIANQDYESAIEIHSLETDESISYADKVVLLGNITNKLINSSTDDKINLIGSTYPLDTITSMDFEQSFDESTRLRSEATVLLTKANRLKAASFEIIYKKYPELRGKGLIYLDQTKNILIIADTDK